jgi:protocatechuate 3,4-dioxygenase beta subunit
MRIVPSLLAVVTLFASASAYAANCTPTPVIATQNYPGYARIQNSNNLLQPAGKALVAEGQRVTVFGRLVDARCMPIGEAQIEIWQVDPFGRWLLATGGDLASPNAVFAGAGRTYTDQNGNFSFITAFPGALKGRAPHFNIRVRASDEKPFDTVLYFADDGRNAKDPAFARQRGNAPVLQVNETPQGLQGRTQLVVPFKARYVTY